MRDSIAPHDANLVLKLTHKFGSPTFENGPEVTKAAGLWHGLNRCREHHAARPFSNLCRTVVGSIRIERSLAAWPIRADTAGQSSADVSAVQCPFQDPTFDQGREDAFACALVQPP